MTPEREADIRHIIPYWTPTTAGTAIEDLLAEINELREKHALLKEAAKHVTTVFHDERKGDLRLAMDSLSVALEGK